MLIKAHPTTYSGARFRSRLEARWACFFDLLGWRWEYEPIDVDGWAPDFVLQGRANVWVEVKPIEWVGQNVDTYCTQVVRDDLKKVRRGTLVLGLYPIPLDYDRPFLGVVIDHPCIPVYLGGKPIDFGDAQQGVLGGQTLIAAPWGHIGTLWRQAGSTVQWRGR